MFGSKLLGKITTGKRVKYNGHSPSFIYWIFLEHLHACKESLEIANPVTLNIYNDDAK